MKQVIISKIETEFEIKEQVATLDDGVLTFHDINIADDVLFFCFNDESTREEDNDEHYELDKEGLYKHSDLFYGAKELIYVCNDGIFTFDLTEGSKRKC